MKIYYPKLKDNNYTIEIIEDCFVSESPSENNIHKDGLSENIISKIYISDVYCETLKISAALHVRRNKRKFNELIKLIDVFSYLSNQNRNKPIEKPISLEQLSKYVSSMYIDFVGGIIQDSGSLYYFSKEDLNKVRNITETINKKKYENVKCLAVLFKKFKPIMFAINGGDNCSTNVADMITDVFGVPNMPRATIESTFNVLNDNIAFNNYNNKNNKVDRSEFNILHNNYEYVAINSTPIFKLFSPSYLTDFKFRFYSCAEKKLIGKYFLFSSLDHLLNLYNMSFSIWTTKHPCIACEPVVWNSYYIDAKNVLKNQVIITSNFYLERHNKCEYIEYSLLIKRFYKKTK